MDVKQINTELLRQKIEIIGMPMASIKTDVSISTLEKIRCGAYTRKITNKTLQKICKGLKIKITDLVPSLKGVA